MNWYIILSAVCCFNGKHAAVAATAGAMLFRCCCLAQTHPKLDQLHECEVHEQGISMSGVSTSFQEQPRAHAKSKKGKAASLRETHTAALLMEGYCLSVVQVLCSPLPKYIDGKFRIQSTSSDSGRKADRKELFGVGFATRGVVMVDQTTQLEAVELVLVLADVCHHVTLAV